MNDRRFFRCYCVEEWLGKCAEPKGSNFGGTNLGGSAQLPSGNAFGMGSLAPMGGVGQSSVPHDLNEPNSSGGFPGMGSLGTRSSSLSALGSTPMNNPWQPPAAPQTRGNQQNPPPIGGHPPPGLPMRQRTSPMPKQQEVSTLDRLNNLDLEKRKQVENTLLSFLE